MIKKLVGAALAAVLTVAMAATALASPSSNFEANKDVQLADQENKFVSVQTLTTEEVAKFFNVLTEKQAQVLEALGVKSFDQEGVRFIAPVDVAIKGTGSQTFNMNIPGATEKDVVIAVHLKANGDLEYILGVYVEDGVFAFQFNNGGSPVSFVVKEGAAVTVPAPNPAPAPGETTTFPTTEPAAKTDPTTSPKTADNGVAAAAIVALLAVAGIVVVSRRKAEQ